MEPWPRDKMPPNHLLPIVRAVVYTALVDWGMQAGEVDVSAETCAAFIADRLCETLNQDHWDQSDRVRRALTKLTWGVGDDDAIVVTEASA